MLKTFSITIIIGGFENLQFIITRKRIKIIGLLNLQLKKSSSSYNTTEFRKILNEIFMIILVLQTLFSVPKWKVGSSNYKFQFFSGELNNDTIRMMKMPRCGVKDKRNPRPVEHSRFRRYVLEGKNNNHQKKLIRRNPVLWKPI